MRKLTLGIGLNRELPVQPDHPVIQDLHFISPRAATKQAARCSLRVTWVTDMAILCKQKNTPLEKHICTKGTKPMHWRASFAGFDLFLSNPLFGSREFDIEHFKARVIRYIMNYIHVYTDYIHIVLHRSMNRVRRCAQAMRLPPQKQRCLQRRSRGCGRRKTSQIIARRTNLRPFIYRMYPYVYIILYIYYTEYSL